MEIDAQSIILKHAIESEKNGTGFVCSAKDRIVFESMAEEINKTFGTKFHFIAEFFHYNIDGAGSIIVKYLNQFESITMRCYFIDNVVSDRVKNCSETVYQLFLDYKNSRQYNNRNGFEAVILDNCIIKLKPKKMKKELTELIRYPKDAYLLPFTTRMLASWKLPEMEPLLKKYLQCSLITERDYVFENESQNEIAGFIQFANRQLFFSAVNGLKYFPSEENAGLIQPLLFSSDNDIAAAAKKTLRYMEKHVNQGG